jgi:hypothetical protein
MAASNHLSPKLFHGTSHIFSEGDIVQPTMETHPLEGKYAFATTELTDAQNWAAKAAQRAGVPSGPVYEVESPDAERHPLGLTIHVSKTGFTPKNIVAWGNNPDTKDSK